MKLGNVSTYLGFTCSQANITCLPGGRELRMFLATGVSIIDAGCSILEDRQVRTRQNVIEYRISSIENQIDKPVTSRQELSLRNNKQMNKDLI